MMHLFYSLKRTAGLLTALGLGLIAPLTASAASSLPGGFVETKILPSASFNSPTNAAFAPDGRLFVTEAAGTVRVVENGILLPQPFVTVSVFYQQNGALISVAFDPNFATNQYVYLQYTTDTPIVHNRVTRVTANGNVAVPGSEVVIFDLDLIKTGVHNGGAMIFGPDGKLYIASGDDFQYAPAQSLSSLLGKMLRINPDGSIPTDNPFYNSVTDKYRAIWAYGIRQPFTACFQPGTGKLFLNDVGYATWEEIDDIKPGGNYGWPTVEGPDTTGTPDPNFLYPIYTYHHGTASNQGCCITGGAFYNPTTRQYPDAYVGKYFFLDFCNQWIKILDPATNTISDFGTGIAPSAICLNLSPDGSLYYIAHDDDSLYRISYNGVLSPQIGSQPQSQLVSVGYPATFSVTASGTALTYQWLRNGGNLVGATSASYTLASAALADDGAQFSCRVSNQSGTALTASATLSVTTNQPPVISIDLPLQSGPNQNIANCPFSPIAPADQLFSAGDTINFSGTANDPEDGPLAPSAYTWQVDFHHHYTQGAAHVHPYMSATGNITSGSFTTPTLGETDSDVWYRLILQATDSTGLTTVTYRDVLPRTSNITLASNPPGLQVSIDGPAKATPFTVTSIVNFTRLLGVGNLQTLNGKTYQFNSWSDGGAASHTVSAPITDTTYTATFNEVVPVNGAAFVNQTVPTTMTAGQFQEVLVTIQNSGSTTWTPGNYYLLSENPEGNSTWNRTQVPLPYSVAPGQNATFDFAVKAPETVGSYAFQWRMAQSGTSFGQASPNLAVTSRLVGNAAAYLSQQVAPTMIAGQRYAVSLTFKNVGTNTWTTGSYFLGSENTQDNFIWGTNRVALTQNVAPGASVTFNFTVPAPGVPDFYNFQWQMIQANVSWFGDFSDNARPQVQSAPNAAAFVSQSVPTSVGLGESFDVSVTLRNVGTNTWTPGSTNGYFLGSENPRDNTTWGTNRMALTTSVAPGQTFTFSLLATAPLVAGNYNFQWRMLQDLVAWFGDASDNSVVNVQQKPNGSVFISQNLPATMAPGQTYPVSLTFKNTGSSNWSPGSSYWLGSENPRDNTTWGTNRASLPAVIPAGGTGTITFNVKAPAASGNYNFQWRMLQDGVGWFGGASTNVLISVQQPANAAQFVSQNVPGNMVAGQNYNVSVTFKNTGANTWNAGSGYWLGSANPRDNTIWGTNRQVLSGPVLSGGNATFTFRVTAPPTAGTYNFQWQMLQDLVAWFGDVTTNVPITVTKSANAAAFVSQSAPGTMLPGQSYNLSVTMKNVGTATWTAGSLYRLGSSNPQDNKTWGTSRIALPASVAPGSTATFAFTVKAPPTSGNYNFQWQMVQDGVGWFGDLSANVPITVALPLNDATFVSQTLLNSMTAGEAYTATVVMKNTGSATWTAGSNYYLGAENPRDNTTWGANRATLPNDVPSGSMATFTFPVRAPLTTGTYNFQWKMVQDTVGWFGAVTTNVPVAVGGTPKNGATFVSQNVPASMAAGQTYSVSVTMKNVGTATWTAAGLYRLGSQNPQDNKTWGTNRQYLPASVAPGSTATFNFTVKAPATLGNYNFQWKMVQDGVQWFGEFTTNAVVNVGTTAQSVANAATFVAQTNPPAAMKSGQIATVSVTMKNIGTATWTAGTNFRLGSQNPADNTNWGPPRVYLPTSVAPGSQVTFSFPATAPSLAGTYNFQWRMIQEGVQWFGDYSTSSAVSVTVPPPLPPGRMEVLDVAGITLQGNPLGDQVSRRVALFIPQQVQAGQAVPIVYFLPAYGASSEDYIAQGSSSPFSTLVQSMADAGQPIIIAVPDGRTRYGGSQYLNSTAQGNYADYVATEIVAAVEARYPAAPGRLGRIIAGHSSGGYGALRFGMSQQALFGAVIALSPDSEFQVTHLPLVQSSTVSSVTLQTVADCSGPVATASPPNSTVALVFGLSAAYAPAGGDQPGRFRWLYDSAGAFQADVWQKWLDNDPLLIVRANVNAFASDQRIYLDGAANDEWGFNVSARHIYDALSTRPAPVTFNEPPGYHGSNIPGRLSDGLHWVFGLGS